MTPSFSKVGASTRPGALQDAAGVFGGRIAALAADAVVDMVCFTPESAQQLVDALRPARPLLLHCGTIWVHGPASRVPVTEDEPRTAYGDYGTRIVDWSEFERRVGADHAEVSREHVGRSIAASIDRARDVLGYRPRYSSLDALHESLRWLAENGHVDLDDQNF